MTGWVYGLIAAVLLVGGVFVFGRKSGKDVVEKKCAEDAVEELNNDQKIDTDIRALDLDLARKRMREKIRK